MSKKLSNWLTPPPSAYLGLKLDESGSMKVMATMSDFMIWIKN
jgi:hypothetical protein